MREVSQRAKDLSVYRLQRANEDLNSANNTFAAGDYRTANNRAYYAIFHSLTFVFRAIKYLYRINVVLCL